jgi:Methyltransferase domain
MPDVFFAAPNSKSNEFRAKRFKIFLEMVSRHLDSNRECKIIDVGGTKEYWDLFAEQLKALPVRLTVVNLGLAPNKNSVGEFSIETCAGDGTKLEMFQDGAFDIVHSNSVIEHVGLWPRMKQMAAEIRRLAPRYYVQTPNYWFPYDPHSRTLFFHYLPYPVRRKLLAIRRCGFYEQTKDLDEAMRCIEDAILLERAQMAYLFPDARLVPEKFFGFTKSWIAIK